MPSKVSKEVILDKISELMNEVASIKAEVAMLRNCISSGQKPGINYASNFNRDFDAILRGEL